MPGTGLMYYHARYYHPALGRFVSADTVVPEAGNPQSLNRYSYVLNNPLKYIDPTGYIEEKVTSYFHKIDEAEEFLNMLQAYLWLIEYEYDTDLDSLLGIGTNEGGPEVAEAIAKTLKVEPTIVGWIATLYTAGIDEGNKEGLKTLRRFRDDLNEAITLWQHSTSETMHLELSISNAGFLQVDVYSISLWDEVELTPEEQRIRWFNNKIETRTIEYWHHVAGGPLGGSVNSFGKVTIDLMVDYIPKSGGVVQYQRKGWNYSVIYE